MSTASPRGDMRPRIVLLSGHVGSGKTTLARGLVGRFGGSHLKTGELLASQLEDLHNLDRDRFRMLETRSIDGQKGCGFSQPWSSS